MNSFTVKTLVVSHLIVPFTLPPLPPLPPLIHPGITSPGLSTALPGKSSEEGASVSAP